MATWKKLLHEDSEIAITQIENLGGGTAVAEGDVIIGSAAGQVENYELTHKKILIGDSSNNAKIGNLITNAGGAGGDITVNNVSSASGMDVDVQLQIAADVVTTAKLVDNAVTLAKTAHQGGHGIVVYDDNVSDGDGVPTFVAGGTPGQVLKVNSGADGFEFADGDSASTVDIDVHDATRRSVIFGGDADDNADTGVTLNKDYGGDFTYLADLTFAADLYEDSDGTTISAATMGAVTANLHVNHIKTDIAGTAGAAAKVYATKDESTAASFPIAFMSNGSSAAISSSSYGSAAFDSSFYYNPNIAQLVVDNLKVTGTNTIVNTTTLTVDDKTIRVANDVGGSGTATSEARNSGLVINIGVNTDNGSGITEDNADNTLPRILWTEGSATTQGWAIADKGTGSDSDLVESNAVGIAVLEYDTADVTQATLEDSGTYDHFGIGAFYLVDTAGTPELYIRTA